MTWIIVQTKSNNEKKAFMNLSRQGFNVFYPKVLKSSRSFNRIRKTIKPLFPGYVFVNLNKNQNWIKINNTFGVRTILKVGKTIYKLPKEILSQIKKRCDDHDVCQILPLKKGDEINIVNAKYPSLKAIFAEYIDEKRAFVFLDFLNRKIKTKVFNNSIESLN